MKKTIAILLLFTTSFIFSQNGNSLLWKISGNGLEKDSYLFGTMHVSERIAFHLDDVFYESILKSDFVALESNPETWLDYSFKSDEFTNRGNQSDNSIGRNFYNKNFKFDLPNLNQLSMLLSNEHFLLNGILYRTNPMAQDIQEDTYLDMFIFQSGSKLGKKVVGLEDNERSANLVKKATKGDFRKESTDLWLQKLMKEKQYYDLLSDAYRDRNISFLDSLNTGIYNEKYLDNMLYIRNEDMVIGIDSLVKHGSVFSAVGAAHLGGEKGVIQKLRDRGYTVTPLTSEITSKGKEIKEKIENKEAAVKYTLRKSSDNFFSVKSTSKLYKIDERFIKIYISPNIRNAAYHTIIRISTLNEFGGKIKSLDDLDRILFEKIPGKTISKKEITKNGYKGLDIINQTKIGDYQRSQIFITPLEVIIFKMAGKRDYVLNNGGFFFDSIELLNDSIEEFTLVSPKYNGFEILMPRNHIFGNKDKRGDRLIQSTDKNGNYYFVKEVVLNDLNYLEEDDFELKRIHNRFYKNMKLEIDTGNFEGNGKLRAFVSKSKKTKEDKIIHLKTVLRGAHYYLIGKTGNSVVKPEKYFNSFQFTELVNSPEDLEIRKDTGLHFSVKTFVKPTYSYRNNNRPKKKYKSYTKTSNFNSNTNERIQVKLEKFHDWKYFVNIDSLWNSELNKYRKKDYSNVNIDRIIIENLNSYLSSIKKYKITNKTNGEDAFGNKFQSYLLRDTLTDRAVKIKQVLSNGKLYTLKTLIDVRHQESGFVKDFYSSFQPDTGNVKSSNLFKSPVQTFVKALKNNDSIAIESYNEISFQKEHTDVLINLLNDDSFNSSQQLIKDYLIKQLVKFKTKRVIKFIDQLYEESFENPESQITIFKSFAKDKNSTSYKKLRSLLATDIPITNRSSDIALMFRQLNDSLPLAKDLFPEFLTYTTVNEYKKPIYSLLTELVEKELIKAKEYKKYKNQILTEARIELKKQLSSTIEKKKNNFKEGYNNNYYSRSMDNNLLKLYIKLLSPFIKDSNVKNLFSKIPLIDNVDIKVTYITELVKAKQKVPAELLDEILKDLEGRFSLFSSLKKIDRLYIIPTSYLTKEKMYKAAVLKNIKVTKKDSVAFIASKELTIKDTAFEVYFYKVKKASKSQYSKPKWQIHFAAFKKSEKGILIRPYHSKRNQFIDETEPIEKQLKIHLEKIRLKDRKRVDLSIKNNGSFGYF